MTKQNLILIGFKSSGKTFFGRLLAERLNKPFIDTDCLIEQLYAEEHDDQKTCREIALHLGLPGFRLLENQAIASLSLTTNSIIATGGGTLLDSNNLQILQQLGPLIYLNVCKDTLKNRILSENRPSILDLKNFDALLKGRLPHYEKAALHTLHTENKSSEEILAELQTLVII